MIMFCTHEGDHQVNALVCAFSCPQAVKLKCAEYKNHYEKLKSLLIDQQYLTKYGLPSFPDPNAKKPERTRKERADKGKKKVAKVEAKPVAVPAEAPMEKRKRRTKAEMESARSKK